MNRYIFKRADFQTLRESGNIITMCSFFLLYLIRNIDIKTTICSEICLLKCGTTTKSNTTFSFCVWMFNGATVRACKNAAQVRTAFHSVAASSRPARCRAWRLVASVSRLRGGLSSSPHPAPSPSCRAFIADDTADLVLTASAWRWCAQSESAKWMRWHKSESNACRPSMNKASRSTAKLERPSSSVPAMHSVSDKFKPMYAN